jgi:NADPH:quinone reductase-like Zn-dependent oxidoreductase
MTEYGGPEVPKIARSLRATGAAQVRVRHTRIGVNFHDIYVRSGFTRRWRCRARPASKPWGG